MKARPTIFLSGVSHEFGSFRDAVENEIEMKGCFAENQPGFPPDYRTVEEMLRRKLHDSDALIHIVGFRFGAEPNQRPPGVDRRSYTQMEFDIARELEKPVYIFLSREPSVRDPLQRDEKTGAELPDPPQDEEATALQLAHRRAVQATNYLFYHFKDQAELRRLVAEIPIVAAAEFKADISRIVKYAPAELIGREAETKLLDDVWLKVRRSESPRPHILTFVALGGEGKTSLIAKWAAELAHQNWPGCDAVFAWSFYSQGTREQVAASSDLFLKEALLFFGDTAMAESAQGAFDKGRRLAQLVGEQRVLLILDGLEPLQYAPTSPTPGQLKDQGIAALLKGLAAASHGLCVVTTRYSVPDLKAFWQTTAPEVKLLRLSREAGMHLLKTFGVRGTAQEFEKLVEDVKGHALTLTLLGGFLSRAFHGDIRQRDRVKFEKADEKMDGGHAFRTMAAYEQWLLRDGGDEGRREVAVLRLMGLFDRPADTGCLAALRRDTIPGLTEPLAGLADDDWEFCLSGLEVAKLLTVNRDASGALVSLDAHPLVREYFARRLHEERNDAWILAHRRLFELLKAQAPISDRPSLEELQPIYQAVRHGCFGLLYKESFNLFAEQIARRNMTYSITFLGAFNSDLSCLANFFREGWTQIIPELEAYALVVLGTVGYSLRGSGRLSEALSPSRESVNLSTGITDVNASIASKNLAELLMTLGDLESASDAAKRSVQRADSLSESQRNELWTDIEIEMMPVINRTCLASILHARGSLGSAINLCIEAEHRQRSIQPNYPILYSEQGYHFFRMLAHPLERISWIATLQDAFGTEYGSLAKREEITNLINTTWLRIDQGLKWACKHDFPLDLGLCYLANYKIATWVRRIFPDENFYVPFAADHLDRAMSWLRRASDTIHLVDGIISGSIHRKSTGDIGAAIQDLDEAWEIAERGPMKLFLADIHLHRARLFFREAQYPWDRHPDGSPRGAQDDLKAARKLIEQCGYGRRREELEDAESVILQ